MNIYKQRVMKRLFGDSKFNDKFDFTNIFQYVKKLQSRIDAGFSSLKNSFSKEELKSPVLKFGEPRISLINEAKRNCQILLDDYIDNLKKEKFMSAEMNLNNLDLILRGASDTPDYKQIRNQAKSGISYLLKQTDMLKKGFGEKY